jgi:hypothetical protein
MALKAIDVYYNSIEIFLPVSRMGFFFFFYHSNLSNFGTVQSALGVSGCGCEIFYNMCFGHLLVAVSQGQRRDAASTEEEQLERCRAGQSKLIRLYWHSGK